MDESAAAPDLYRRAAAAMGAGRRAEAEALTRQLLTREPQHGDALNLLGILAMQAERAAEAEPLFVRATQADPRNASYRSNLGLALRRLGRLDEARSACRAAIELTPGFAEGHNNLGLVALAADDPAGALAAFDAAVKLRPDYADALYNRAVALEALRRFPQAAAGFAAALALRPDYPGAKLRQAAALLRAGKHEEALALARELVEAAPDAAEPRELLADVHLALGEAALAKAGHLHWKQQRHSRALALYERLSQLAPNNPSAWNGVGLALSCLGRHGEAEAPLRRSLQLRPDYPSALNNLALARAARGDHREAIALFGRALAIDSRFAEGHNNLGASLMAVGRYAEAAQSFARAAEVKPDYAGAHMNLGIARLTLGDFAGGWPEYAWRWKVAEFPSPKRDFKPPRWNGEPLAGRTILLHAEQGVGDAIQFIRYAPVVAERGGQVIIEVPPEMMGLMRGFDPRFPVIPRRGPLPAFDLHCPLLSVPEVLGTDLTSIPTQVPYLSADAARRSAWRETLAALPGLKIGFAWAGNPKHKKDALRSVAASAFAPLLEVRGTSWVSLQVGGKAAELAALPAQRVFDAAPQLKDFADTAALIAELELVISVDTAIVHLAGALARPVWVLTPYCPDWRWMLARGDSPWYPTLRLFRQSAAEDWPPVFTALAEALRTEVAPRAA
jgi:tetratricopeptide (TPR) repeat protein